MCLESLVTVHFRVEVVVTFPWFCVFLNAWFENRRAQKKKKLVNFPFFPKILFWKIFLAHGRPTAYVTANYAGFSNSPGSTTEYGSARVMLVYGHAHLVCSAVNQSYICRRWPEFSSCGFGSAAILNQLYHWASYDWSIFKKLLFFSVKRSSANSDA